MEKLIKVVILVGYPQNKRTDLGLIMSGFLSLDIGYGFCIFSRLVFSP